MKTKRIITTVIAILCMMILTVSAFAEDNTVLNALTGDKVDIAEDVAVKISCGLDVIAKRNEMTMAGIKGNPLYFSSDRFACAMNLARVEYVTVTRLPDAVCGSLFIGSEGVSVGQRIKASELALVTYEEAQAGVGSAASFDFQINGSAYEMTCNILMIDEVNYSPTVSVASALSLRTETYCDVQVSGVIAAYDPEGDPLTYEIVDYPAHGRLVLEDSSLGTYTYIPDEGYTGEDLFRYVARDHYGNYSAAETVKLSIAASGIAPVYSDLIDDALHSHAIAMTECGLMNGIQVGDYYYFDADREVSRAEFLVTAMNAVGIKNVPEAEKTGFADDVDINPEMKGYVALAYSKGYVSGKKVNGELCFRPDEKIRLSEAAVIISNMIGYAEPKVVTVFADADNIPSWSGKAIDSLYTLGILEVPDRVAGANRTVTRGDMAKLLNKMMLAVGR